MKRGIWFLLFLLAGYAQFQVLFPVTYKKSDTLNVLATKLNLREKPESKSPVIEVIPYGAKVAVMERTSVPFTSEGIYGFWVRVKYGKNTGYIFDGYLSVLPAPPENCKSLEDYADRKFGKSGNKIEKKITPEDEKNGLSQKYIQNYKNGAMLEFVAAYESDWQILTLKNISLEEGFLIGRLCGGQNSNVFKGKNFSPPKDDKIHVQGDSVVIEELEIQKTKNGDVRIKAWHGV